MLRAGVVRSALQSKQRATATRSTSTFAGESTAEATSSNSSPILPDASSEPTTFGVLAESTQIPRDTRNKQNVFSVSLRRVNRLSNANDVRRYFEELDLKPESMYRAFTGNRARVVGWQVQFATRAEAHAASKLVTTKPIGAYNQLKALAVVNQSLRDPVIVDDDCWVQISRVPLSADRRDVSRFAKVGSNIIPSIILQRIQVISGQKTGTWLVKYHSAEDRSLAMIKRSNQRILKYGSDFEFLSDEPVLVTPVAAI